VVKQNEDQKKKQAVEALKQKNIKKEAKDKKQQELRKKQVATYKVQKEMTRDLLANADLPGFDDDEDDYSDDYDGQTDTANLEGKTEGGDTGQYLDNMLAQYKERSQRPPPAVL
jgi:hypothetical protein